MQQLVSEVFAGVHTAIYRPVPYRIQARELYFPGGKEAGYKQRAGPLAIHSFAMLSY